MKKVAIVYHYLAHYRLPIFKELCKCEATKFTLISGPNTNYLKTIDEGLANVKIENGGLRWHFVKNIWISNEKILWQKGIIKICFSNEFDEYIFLGNPYFLSTWVATFILKVRKKPVYFWTHGLLKKEVGIKGLIRNVFLKLPNGIFLYGNYAKNILISQGFDPEKLHVIYNSLDYEYQIKLRGSMTDEACLSFRANYFKYPTLPQLIFIGRLTKQKKLNQIIEAMYLLHQKGLKINLFLVGDGDEKPHLEKIIKVKGLIDFICFFGSSYTEDDNYKLIVSSDICVSPGEVGLTAMHSLVYGTPVITHNNFTEQMPEFEAIEKDFSGNFFEQDNILDLSNKIEKWLIDKINKLEIQQNCYKIIDSKYNPVFQKETILNIINDKEANKIN